jgi:predicted nucleic acid-binding protein
LTPATQKVFDQVVAAGARAPSLWHIKVAHSLQGGIRRGLISKEFRDAVLTDLGLLDITIDSDTDTFAGSTTLRLAQQCELTLYNAAYLELVQRFELPLTTLNQELHTAGNTLGLTLLAQ